MSSFFADHLLTRTSLRKNACQVSHCAGRYKECSLASKNLRCTILQAVYGGIFDEHVIADFRFGHRTPHFRRRPGDGIASQVDNRLGHSNSSVTPLASSHPPGVSLK